MVTYIIRRLLWAILLLFVVSFITFVMFILLPSADPAVLRAGRQPTPELIAAIRENLGLDKPWYHQYYVYMRDLILHFDFGYSYQNNVAVRTTIFDRLPATASLAIGAAVVWLLIGIPIGIISAIKRGTIMDRAAMGFALLAISAPVYWVGLMGMTRRMQHYDNLAWQPWLLVAGVGAVIILAGIVCQAVQLVVSIRTREQRRVTGDPWNGRTLEWSTASPPPAWNFAVLPQVTAKDAFWDAKQQAVAVRLQPAQERRYKPIEMPKNSPTGFINAFFAVVIGFAMIWHIWWMAGVGLLGIFATVLAFALRQEEEIEIPADELARLDHDHPVLQHKQVEIAA